jgi:hypothetical protein
MLTPRACTRVSGMRTGCDAAGRPCRPRCTKPRRGRQSAAARGSSQARGPGGGRRSVGPGFRDWIRALSMSGLRTLPRSGAFAVRHRWTPHCGPPPTRCPRCAGAVVLEVWGKHDSRSVASAADAGAQASGVTGLLHGWRRSQRLDGGDAMDRARGAFAARLSRQRVGRAGVRRATRSQPSWPGRPVDHGMEM